MSSVALCTDFDPDTKIEITEKSEGFIVFQVKGKDSLLQELFGNESGGHRIQRVPPTEKRGRVHTSTITVAVFASDSECENSIDSYSDLNEYSKDLEIKTCRGSGAGGQHRNKTETAVQVTHIPTGLAVRSENGRSQYHNKMTAIEQLKTKLASIENEKNNKSVSLDRKNQVGSGMRGDKRRTIRYQDGVVTDHILNIQWNLKKYLKGDYRYDNNGE